MKISEKPLKQYPWYLQPIFRSQIKKYGAVLKSGLIWARIPKLFAAVSILYGVLDRKGSPIEPQLRSIITVRVSQINWCHFCVDLNSAILAERSGSMDKIYALDHWWKSELFNEKERVALEYADTVTYTDRQVSEELKSRLINHFSEEALIELTGLIAFQNLSSKFNAALDIPAQGFCKVPEPAKKNPEY
jgi:AhpD family alkylhydroperoxidase